MKDALSHLEDVLDKRKSFIIGDTLSHGFNIWKQDIWSYMGFGLIYIVIAMIAGSIPVLGQIASSILIGPAMTLGGAIYAYRIATDEKREFGNFFDGFAHWQQIVIGGFIVGLVSILLITPMIFSFGLDFISSMSDPLVLAENIESWSPSTGQIIGIFISIILLIYFSIAVSFTFFFVGFYELDAITSLQYSFKFVNRHWLWVFIYTFVASLAAMSGMILLIVGIFLTFPMLYAMQFAAFEELTEVIDYYKGGGDEDININDMFGEA